LECKHCILEIYGANVLKLNDEALIRLALTEASAAANATLIDIKTHAFSPQGVTGFALLAESHISIHTWPEANYAAVDAFTCGDTTRPDDACKYLSEFFEATGYSLNFVERFTPKLINKVDLTLVS
jgi:S-adenosylmethionine decarboxylase